jgi:hypothetical protein
MNKENKSTKEQLKKQKLADALKKNILRRKSTSDTICD